MLSKIIQLEDRFPTGEPTLMVVAREGRSGWLHEKRALASSASPALDYIQNVAPRAGSTIVLVNALGAFETYDDNRNGDAFPELPYNVGKPALCGHQGCQSKDGWLGSDEVLTRHYQTFEQFGGIYEHHVNKDPSKSLGKILKAFWNARMHRVELLLELINARKPELVARINDGDFPAVSMGCHVKWDVCSVCGHRAPTRREYCDHLKFSMRKIDPRTGVRYCALNPSCRFFDISIVIRPADTTGFMMKKVAEESRLWWPGADLGAKVAEFNTKQALVRKLSDIQKDLVGDVMAARITDEGGLVKNYRKRVIDAAPDLAAAGPAEVAKMARYGLPQVFSTLAKRGAALSASETAALLLAKCGYAISAVELDKVAASLPLVNEIFAQDPELYAKLASTVEVDPRHVSPALAADLGPWLDKRAGIDDWFRQTAHDAGGPFGRGAPAGPGAAYEAHAPPKTDVLTMTDPNTGETYKTTRGAVQSAKDTNYRSLLGGAALLSGAYALALGRLPLARRMSLTSRALMGVPLAAGTLHLGRQFVDPYEGDYMTDQGLLAPGNTEFRKTSSLATPMLLDKFANDYASRLHPALRRGDLSSALTQKIAWTAGSADPLVRFLLDPTPMTTKVSSLLAGAREPSYESTEADAIDFDRASLAVGHLLTVA